MDKRKERKLKKEARFLNIKEGIYASSSQAFGNNYVSPFAIAINASNSVVALLGSVLGILGPLSQTFGSKLTEKYSRKKLCAVGSLLEALSWILFVGIALLYYFGIITSFLPIILIFAFSLYIIFWYFWQPAWFSWTGDLVGEKYRGRWFAKKTLLVGFISIVFSLVAALILDYARGRGIVMGGFILLFVLALIFRIFSNKTIKKAYEPELKIDKKNYFSFWSFLKRSGKTNFGRFSRYRFFFDFFVAMSSTLLVVYLLRYLNFSYTIYILITLAISLFSIIVVLFWGEIADRFGEYKILILTSLTLPLVPVLWIMGSSPLYLILVPALISGVSWSGFNLATRNFVYDNVSKEKRAVAVSYFNLLKGMGVFLGAGLASILIAYLPGRFLEPLFVLFIISAVGRLAISAIWLPRIREVEKKRSPGKKGIPNLIRKEFKPTILEEAHDVLSIGRYLRRG